MEKYFSLQKAFGRLVVITEEDGVFDFPQSIGRIDVVRPDQLFALALQHYNLQLMCVGDVQLVFWRFDLSSRGSVKLFPIPEPKPLPAADQLRFVQTEPLSSNTFGGVSEGWYRVKDGPLVKISYSKDGTALELFLLKNTAIPSNSQTIDLTIQRKCAFKPTVLAEQQYSLPFQLYTILQNLSALPKIEADLLDQLKVLLASISHYASINDPAVFPLWAGDLAIWY